MAKLQFVSEWLIDDWNINRLPPARVQQLAQLARRSSNQALQRKSPQQRYPLLMAFLADTCQRLTDEVLDLYDHRISQTDRDARRDLRDYRLRLSESLQQQLEYFGHIAHIILDNELSDAAVRPRIFEIVPRPQLEQLLDDIAAQQGKLDALHFFSNRYTYLRQFFPTLIETLTFHPHQSPEPLLEALQILHDLNATGGKLPKYLEDAPTAFVPATWRSRVINRDGRVNRRSYDLCVMWELRNALRSGQVWVEHSRRYTNLEAYLIPQEQWPERRAVFLELVPIQADSHERLRHLQDQLETAYQELDNQLPDDDALRIEDGRIILTPFDAVPVDSPLSDQIQALMPHLQLAELLHEVDRWVHFSDHFEHAAGSTSRIEQLDRHLYACCWLKPAISISIRWSMWWTYLPADDLV
nr:hypothetical protein [Anaerolineae bacterium]